MRACMLLLALCLPAIARAASVDDVLAADRAFAEMAKAKGARAAFVAFADADAIMFRDGVGPIKGVEAIGRAFREPPAATPEWEPRAAEVAASGDLAYSWGFFTWTPVAGGPLDGKPPLTGYYVTVWKKSNGAWKWVADLGVQAPK